LVAVPALFVCSSAPLASSRPPRPTLFPYTTLFRSDHSFQSMTVVVCLLFFQSQNVKHESVQQCAELVKVFFVDRFRTLFQQIDVNRKSTRLNSSHVNISYAVFCLKKKKI